MGQRLQYSILYTNNKSNMMQNQKAYVHQNSQTYKTGASCSKLMMLLVNDLLKFQMAILEIHCYFCLKKCENPAVQRILTFFQQKITVYLLLKLIYSLQIEALTTALS